MNEILLKIISDLQILFIAICISKKNPFFIFEEIFYVCAPLVLILFLTSLGRKILRMFGCSDGKRAEELLFSLGIGIIVWGTFVLLLGMLGILSSGLLWLVAAVSFLLLSPEAVRVLGELRGLRVRKPRRKFEKVLLTFFLIFVFFNFIGALIPEKGVDALGYHLYFPKVYLQNHTMMLQARGSRLFSLFPHLASMIYILPVSLNLPNVAQLFHFWLGVFTAITLGLITNSMVVCLVFYSTILVGSISRSAYSDFFVTFFLSLGILGLVKVFGKDKEGGRKKLIMAGLMFGGVLAIKNQSLALIPLLIFWWIILSKKKLNSLITVFLASILVPLLWYLRSFLVSGNPFYPMFESQGIRVPQFNLNFYLNFEFLKYLRVIFLFQPIFLLVFVFINKKLKKHFFLGILVFLYWLFLPESFHDNRYFLPYFIVITLSFSPILERITKEKWGILGLMVVLAVLVLPRIYTNSFYLPYIFGFEEKKVYLSNALRTRPEDFYDIDGIFSTTMKRVKWDNGEKKVLVDNTLGLYYVDFPFDEYEYSSFYGKKFNQDEFKDRWKEKGYLFLLLKNESLNDFFDKIGMVGENQNLFKLVVSHSPSQTYLYQPEF